MVSEDDDDQPPPRLRRDRDQLVRKDTPRGGVPGFVVEEGTGVHEGEALARVRGNRQTPHRFRKLEEFKDETIKDIGAIKLSIVRMEGDNKTLNEKVDGYSKATSISLTNIEKHLSENRQREHVTFTAQVDVGAAQAKDVIHAKQSGRDLLKTKLELYGKGLAVVVAAIGLFAAGRC